MTAKNDMPEMPVIRPPSEWKSVLVRLTRGCKWNRCRFCGIYPALGQHDFSIRTVDEIKHDIDLLRGLRPRGQTAFFGDADPLEIGVESFCEVARYLRQSFTIKRLTCYARASTLYRLKEKNIFTLAGAGLNRVHMGLESGDDAILRFHGKGQSAKMVRQVAGWLKKAGVEISFYVLLGLGGRENWRQHIVQTAKLINDTEPEFLRIRRLWLYGTDIGEGGKPCPLWQKIDCGEFSPQTPEGTVLELRLLLENLQSAGTFVACDHANNYVQISGLLPEDKSDMLAEIDSFLALPAATRQAHYDAVGSRI